MSIPVQAESSKAAEAAAEASSSTTTFATAPMDNKIQSDRPQDFDAPVPPMYGEHSADDLINDEILAQLLSEAPHEPSSGGLPLPAVIPQTTQVSSGGYYSPFARAYIPGLEAHGIQKAEFVTFLDGLNEAFIPNPVYEAAGVLGQLMSLYEEDDPMKWLQTGYSIVTGGRTQAMCYAQTKAYIKTMNTDLFHPAGLHFNIMKTSNMMKKVAFPQDKIQLPRLESFDDIQFNPNLRPKDSAQRIAESALPQDDPRMRRMRALEGYVMPIDFNVPSAAMPEDLVRRMGAARAVDLAKSQENALTKRRARGIRMYIRAERRHKRTEARLSRVDSGSGGRLQKLEDLEKKLSKVSLTSTDAKAKPGNAAGDGEDEDFDDDDDATLVDGGSKSRSDYRNARRAARSQRKAERKVARSERRLDRMVNRAERTHAKNEQRENDITDKILWIVISHWNKEENEDSSDEENDLPKGDPPPEPLPGDVRLP